MESEEVMRGCRQCVAPRHGDICHKCGSPTHIPASGWDWPRLPDIEHIRAVAREIGYAIGVHGTLERDLDLIAAPWTEKALEMNHREVMEYIAKGINGRVLDVGAKPLGRWACNIKIDGWFKLIDLSVCPMIVPSS